MEIRRVGEKKIVNGYVCVVVVGGRLCGRVETWFPFLGWVMETQKSRLRNSRDVSLAAGPWPFFHLPPLKGGQSRVQPRAASGPAHRTCNRLAPLCPLRSPCLEGHGSVLRPS